MTKSNPIRLCFVCLGNICRSPTAEGIMLHLVEKHDLGEHMHIDSAGTGAWHAGEGADPRSFDKAKERGVHLPSIARQFVREDFERFDFILAMDQSNYSNILTLAPHDDAKARVYMFRSFDPDSSAEASVPDPYHGGAKGFDEVFDICEAACLGLLEHIRKTHKF